VAPAKEYISWSLDYPIQAKLVNEHRVSKREPRLLACLVLSIARIVAEQETSLENRRDRSATFSNRRIGAIQAKRHRVAAMERGKYIVAEVVLAYLRNLQ